MKRSDLPSAWQNIDEPNVSATTQAFVPSRVSVCAKTQECSMIPEIFCCAHKLFLRLKPVFHLRQHPQQETNLKIDGSFVDVLSGGKWKHILSAFANSKYPPLGHSEKTLCKNNVWEIGTHKASLIALDSNCPQHATASLFHWLLVATKLKAKLHSRYVKESLGVRVGVWYFGKVGVAHFATDSATLSLAKLPFATAFFNFAS